MNKKVTIIIFEKLTSQKKVANVIILLGFSCVSLKFNYSYIQKEGHQCLSCKMKT